MVGARTGTCSSNSSPPIGEELKKKAVNGATVKKMYERKAHNGNGKVKISYGRWLWKNIKRGRDLKKQKHSLNNSNNKLQRLTK